MLAETRGLAAQGGYHAFTLTSPDRLVIDVSHVGLGKFPGIWDITSWPQYWATQAVIRRVQVPRRHGTNAPVRSASADRCCTQDH